MSTADAKEFFALDLTAEVIGKRLNDMGVCWLSARCRDDGGEITIPIKDARAFDIGDRIEVVVRKVAS